MYQKALIEDIIQWDISSWSEALFYWDKEVQWDKIETCLELGGREGGLSLWLALKGKKVVCSDLYLAQDTAQKLHQKYNVSEFVEYREIDATKIPYEDHFDLIVFKSVLGSVGQSGNANAQSESVRQIFKALKPGGLLLFAENTEGSMLHRYGRKKFTKWGDKWLYVTIDKMKQLLADFSELKIKSTGVFAVFGRSEKQKSILASLDKLVLKRVLPSNCHYITYGIARKPMR